MLSPCPQVICCSTWWFLFAGSTEVGLQCYPEQPGGFSWWLDTHRNARQRGQLLGCTEV